MTIMGIDTALTMIYAAAILICPVWRRDHAWKWWHVEWLNPGAPNDGGTATWIAM